MTSLSDNIRDELVRYYRHLGGRVERAVRSVPQDKLWTKPFAFGNSIGHLVLHLTGNLNHYIGALIAGTGYVRNRPKEFSDPNPPGAAEVMGRFQQAIELVAKTLAAQKEGDWLEPVADNPPVETRLGLFVLCAAHLNNHIGQMSYLVQALGHSTQEPPVW